MNPFRLLQRSKWRRKPWYQQMVHMLQLQAARTAEWREICIKILSDDGVVSPAGCLQFETDFDAFAAEYWSEDAVVMGIFATETPPASAKWDERCVTSYAKRFLEQVYHDAYAARAETLLNQQLLPFVEDGTLLREPTEWAIAYALRRSGEYDAVVERAQTLLKQHAGLIVPRRVDKALASVTNKLATDALAQATELSSLDKRITTLEDIVQKESATIESQIAELKATRRQIVAEHDRWETRKAELITKRDSALTMKAAELRRREQAAAASADAARASQATRKKHAFLTNKYDEILSGLSHDARINGFLTTEEELREAADIDMAAYLRDHPEFDQNWTPDVSTTERNNES